MYGTSPGVRGSGSLCRLRRSEMLMRLPKPLDIPEPNPSTIKRRTYKLAPRTIEVTEHLAKTEYGNEGQVLAACIKILKVKKFDSKYLDRDRKN